MSGIRCPEFGSWGFPRGLGDDGRSTKGAEGESFEGGRELVESVSENEYSICEWVAAGHLVSKVVCSHIICRNKPFIFS